MVRCSLCGAEGVNKTSCPFNPDAVNVKPEKHNKKPLPGIPIPKPTAGKPTSTKPTAGKPTSTKPRINIPASGTVVVKPSTTIKIKKPSKPEKPSKPAQGIGYAPDIVSEDSAIQAQYEADYLDLTMPKVPVKQIPIDKSLTDRCSNCVKLINARDKPHLWGGRKDYEIYDAIREYCGQCTNMIAEQYKRDLKAGKKRYKKYHIGPVELSELNKHASKESFYNATMYEGAKHWSNTAAKRSAQLLSKFMPDVPKK